MEATFIHKQCRYIADHLKKIFIFNNENNNK